MAILSTFVLIVARVMLRRYGIRGLLCVAERPTANGCVERVHRSLKDRLRALGFIGEAVGVRRALEIAVRAYNFVPHSSLDMRSPASVFYGRVVRLGLEDVAQEPDYQVSNVFSVGQQVWLRRPEGKRGRGESTFLPERYVVLACKGPYGPCVHGPYGNSTHVRRQENPSLTVS
jgi:hypothetical protein